MPEAKQAGDRAATAPGIDTPDVFFYKGERIGEATATELELACLQTAERYSCRDSESEFSEARAARAEGQSTLREPPAPRR